MPRHDQGTSTGHRWRRAIVLAAVMGVIAVPVGMALTQREGRSSTEVINAPEGSVSTRPFVAEGRPAPGRESWSPWPQALHDARHSGSSTVTGPRHGIVAWRRHLSDSPVPAGPVLARDGTIYLVDADGILHAINPRDGKDAWSADTGSPVTGDLSVSPLVLPGGDVVAASRGGLSAWNPDGKRVWTVRLADSLTSPSTVDGRRIYVGSTSGVLFAVDIVGQEAHLGWQLDLDIGQSYGSVVTDGRGRVYQTSTTGIVAVDDAGSSARVAWQTDARDGLVEVSPGLAPSGTVLLGTNGEHEWAYDRSGQLLWKARRHITYSSPSVTESGLAFVGEHNDQLHVLDVATGREVGRFPTTVTKVAGKTRVWTSVVVDAAHHFFFATRTHYLVGVRPDGHRLFTTDLGASTSSYPALTRDHALVIATDAGDLVKVR